MKQVNVKIKKLHPDAKIPSYAKHGDAGLDLTSITTSNEKGLKVYGTGLAIQIPDGYVGLIFPRSSIANTDMSLTNCVGVIDSGYRGEIKFKFSLNHIGNIKMWSIDINDVIKNLGFNYKPYEVEEIREYKVGEKIGQIVILPYPKVEFEEVTELSETERGSSGFGSTGI